MHSLQKYNAKLLPINYFVILTCSIVN